MKSHLVLIGDIVSSRSLKNRNAIQERLLAAFDELNAQKIGLRSPFTITLGDEFQAVFDIPNHIFRHIFTIQERIWPVQIRFSIGIGEISTQLKPDQPNIGDGPAYYLARAGIEQIKKSKSLLFANGLPPEIEPLIQNNLQLISSLIQKWRASQFPVFTLLLHEKAPQEIAKHLALSDKAVYKAIKSNNLKIIKANLIQIQSLLIQAMEQKQ